MPDLFHFTNFQSMLNIVNSKVIQGSEINIAYGPGVYLTSMAYNYSVDEIIANNWGQSAEFIKGIKERVMYYFKINSDELPGVKNVGKDDQRDVWLYPGDLDLKPLMERKVLRIGHIRNETEWSSHALSM